MSNQSNNTTIKLAFPGGFAGILFLVFLVLKLTGVIAWSWLWVTAPLWGPLAIVAAVLIVFCLFALICAFLP